jgi:hypothetical protein
VLRKDTRASTTAAAGSKEAAAPEDLRKVGRIKSLLEQLEVGRCFSQIAAFFEYAQVDLMSLPPIGKPGDSLLRLSPAAFHRSPGTVGKGSKKDARSQLTGSSESSAAAAAAATAAAAAAALNSAPATPLNAVKSAAAGNGSMTALDAATSEMQVRWFSLQCVA